MNVTTRMIWLYHSQLDKTDLLVFVNRSNYAIANILSEERVLFEVVSNQIV